ncbi:MAG: hypothetical protein R3E31_20500 [Chloroflexota bacterium]
MAAPIHLIGSRLYGFAPERPSTWAYTLPSNLEGFYQINLRGADDMGNRRHGQYYLAWYCGHDTANRSVTAVHIGGGSAAQTEISFAASDPFP